LILVKLTSYEALVVFTDKVQDPYLFLNGLAKADLSVGIISYLLLDFHVNF
jgi:hypothetical protein